jgi:hypothetical protein
VRTIVPYHLGAAACSLFSPDEARASGTDWALGIEARSRALLSDGERAEELFGKAIEHLGRTGVWVELARAHLLYGEWLRREGRRVDARVALTEAHEMFTSMGAAGFAERTRHELLATGATVRKRTVETRDDLTAQEAQIAFLARDGLSNWRLRHNFSSARELLSGIWARCSPSSASADAGSLGQQYTRTGDGLHDGGVAPIGATPLSWPVGHERTS